MNKLVVPGHIGELRYIIPAIQVYAESEEWIYTEDYIEKEFQILKKNNVESVMKKDKTDYTKDAELPRYFGFIERQIPLNTKSPCRITNLGKRFFNAYVNNEQNEVLETLMIAFETNTFGRNNEGCPSSNCNIEAPNVLLISSLILDGVTRKEYASILFEMLEHHSPIVNAIFNIKMLRTSNQQPQNTVRADNKIIPFLLNLGFLEDIKGMLHLSKEVKEKFASRISILPTTNNIDNQNIKKMELLTPEEINQSNSSYRPYITAIKSKPFLLLAGISGTGKSRIVRELARACWDAGSEEYKAQKPRNFEMVQVKPNWHDSSELIGYVSRINGKPEYVVGDFLKFIAKAWENWLSQDQKPYFLCLDEMNLAPVEQYFAEYLSVVESRKVTEDGSVVSDPIVRKDTEGFDSLLQKIAWEKQELNDMFETNGICIPPNLIVVGTVNMDETTFSFSRKVLDRAMTIEMNEVDLHGGLTKRHEQIGKLGNAELVGNAVEGVDVYEAYKDVCDTVIEYLEAVNGKLEGTPFKIAYRTRNEFLLYVVNNLPYNKDEEDNELDKNYVIARALDEITSMKILSRIEGDETKVPEKLLKSLEDTIKEQLEDISGYQYEKEETEEAYGSISLAKLDEMKKKLVSGYTSFWS